MASFEEIERWFEIGLKQKATHLIVVCDTFNYDDFPSYLTGTSEDAKREVDNINGKNMQKVMEVYNLSSEKSEQLEKHRCWEY